MILAIEGSVELAVFAALLLLLALHRDSVRRHWRRGLVVGLLVLLLAVPQHLTNLLYLDAEGMLRTEAANGVVLPFQAGYALAGAVIASVIGSLLRAGWYALITCVVLGAWARIRPDAPLLGSGLPPRWRRLALSLGLGLLAGVAFTGFFEILRVESGQAAELLEAWFPDLAAAAPAERALAVLPAAVSAAVCEELVFRGALLGALLRWLGERRWALPVAAIITALPWALLHLSLTDSPWLKLLQIGLLGLALAWMARRWSLEAAILGHLGLNLASLGMMVALG